MEALQTHELQTEALTLLDQAQNFVIVRNDDEYTSCGEFMLGCKQLIAKIEREFKPIKQAQDEAKRKILDMEKNTKAPVEQALNIVQPVMLDYKREQDRKAREEAARIAEEQRKAKEEAKLKEAEVLEQWGETEAAEAKLKEATIPPRQIKIESTLPKVAGLSTRKKWKARIVDANAVKREFCQPDVQLINIKVANFFAYNERATQAEIAKFCAEIGGIEVYQDEVFAGRRA